jgi:acyl-CoA thioesterase FadM
LSIEYLQPMAFDEQIEIEVRIDYVGDHSYALALSARKPDQSVAFRARLVQVCVSASTMRPVPVPAQLRAALLGAGATPAQKELGAGGGCADGVT